MNITLLGPQASGKGTQGRLLSQKYKLFHLEIGNYLREKARADKEIDEIINKKGKLLSDKLTFSIVKEYLEKYAPSLENIVFDGFPRNVSQYKLLKDYLGRKGRKIDLGLFLDLSEEESIKRLSARRICTRCSWLYNLVTNPPKREGVCDRCGDSLELRPDDRPGTIKERLKSYWTTTLPLVSVFEDQGILVRIDASYPIEKIFLRIESELKRRGLV